MYWRRLGVMVIIELIRYDLSGDGATVLSSTEECGLATDFASLDGHSCHAVTAEELEVVEAPMDELLVAETPVIAMVEK